MSNLIRQSHEMHIDRLEEEKHESWEQNKKLYEKIEALNKQVAVLRDELTDIVTTSVLHDGRVPSETGERIAALLSAIESVAENYVHNDTGYRDLEQAGRMANEAIEAHSELEEDVDRLEQENKVLRAGVEIVRNAIVCYREGVEAFRPKQNEWAGDLDKALNRNKEQTE